MQDPKKFVLGDPRVPAGSSRFAELANVSGSGAKGGYLYKSSTVRNDNGTTTTAAAEYRAWQQPEAIMIASTAKADGNIIAPCFILSSYFNGQNASITHAEAMKRAATYQEAGYPAGRWRLPTEAEIMFMIARQQEGVLPAVWAVGSHYWCADGRYVTVASNGGTVHFKTQSGESHVNRFVYDVWYWGDTAKDPETFWPNMHLVNPNEN